jgi:ABC-type branched-subunit amino acid transport system permease subunit
LGFGLNEYYLEVVARALILGLFALSVDLAWGFTGILSIGQAVFFGLGAYAYAIISLRFPVPGITYGALTAAAILPVVLAAAIAFVGFHTGTHQIYFALITLALGLIFEAVAVVWRGLTGGFDGLINIPFPRFAVPGGWGLTIDRPVTYYYLVLFLCAALYVASHRLVTSPVGSVLEAIRENEERTVFLGYDTRRYKRVIFLLAAGLGGFAGALYAPIAGITSPDLFGFILSAQVVMWVAIGGRASLIGGFLGALTLYIGEALLRDVLLNFYLMIVGLAFIFVVIFFPAGFMGLVDRMIARQAARRGAP